MEGVLLFLRLGGKIDKLDGRIVLVPLVTDDGRSPFPVGEFMRFTHHLLSRSIGPLQELALFPQTDIVVRLLPAFLEVLKLHFRQRPTGDALGHLSIRAYTPDEFPT